MSVTGTHHVAITVSDLETSVRFYVDLLGMDLDASSVLNEHHTFRLFKLMGVKVHVAHLCAGRNGRVDLFHFDSGRKDPLPYDFDRIGLQHLALQVDDLDELGRMLETAGVEVLNEPTHVDNGRRVVFVRDPDGTLIQLVETPFFATPIGRIYLPVRRLFSRFSRQAGRALVGTTVSKNGGNGKPNSAEA